MMSMTMKSVSFQRSSLTGTRVQSGEAFADHVLTELNCAR